MTADGGSDDAENRTGPDAESGGGDQSDPARQPQDLPRTKRGIGEALASARSRAGLSFRELGRRSKVPPGTLQGWIGGRSLPTPALRAAFFDVVDALGLTEQHSHAQWWAAVEQARQAPAAPMSNPYVGLRPYTPQDHEVFFGRDEETDELVRRVLEASTRTGAQSVVALVGPSGSGKSSLLGAGLLGRASGGPLAGWFGAMVTPGQDPVDRIRGALEQCRTQRSTAGAVLVIDQFEELWTISSEEQRREVVALLWSAVEPPPDDMPVACALVVGLRSDYFGQAAELDLLRPALGRAMLLRDVQRGQADEMITGPARTRGVTVDPGLVAVLERDLALGDGPGSRGALPLLSQALAETWDRATTGELTVREYLAAGGTAGAVERAAERAYGQLTSAERLVARELMLRLVRIDLDTPVRRPLAIDAVQTDEAWAAVERFASARLVTVSEDGIELAHEALLQHWPRLRAWVAENVESLQAREYLARAAALWIENGRPDDLLVPVERFGLHRGGTDEAEPMLSADKREFIAASRAHFAARELEQIRTTTRLRQRNRIAVAAFAVATALAVIAGASLANMVRIRNEALSRQIALSAERVSRQNPGLAAQIALASAERADTVEGTSALVGATGAPLPRRVLGRAEATSLVVDAGATLVAQPGGDGALRIWRGAAARGEVDGTPETIPLDPAGGNLFTGAVVTAGSGRTLLAAGGMGGLWLVDASAEPSAVVATLSAGQGTVYSTAFTPDGTTLLAGTADGTLRRWDVSTPAAPRELAPLASGGVPVLALGVGPDGTTVAAAMDLTGVRGWTLHGQRATELPALATSSRVQALAFSPDGGWLAAGEARSRQVSRWRLDGTRATAQAPLGGFEGRINDVDFSPDSREVVAASSDQTMRVFSQPDGAPSRTYPHPAVVTASAFAGDRLVSAASDGTLQWWPRADGLLTASGPGLLQLSTDTTGSRMFASADAGGAVAAWDLTDPARPRRLTSPHLPADATGATGAPVLAVLPDGSGVVGGSANGDLYHWTRVGDGFSPPAVVPLDPGNLVTVIVCAGDGRTLIASSVVSDKAFVLRRQDDRYVVTSSMTVDRPQSMALSPDGRLAAIPDINGAVGLWRIDAAGVATAAGALPANASFGTAAVFHPNGTVVAIGTDAGEVMLYDVSDPARPRQVADERRVEGAIYGLSFTPDGRRLAGGAGDQRVWIWGWDGSALKPWAWINAGLDRVNDVRFIDGGRRLVAVGGNGGAGMWDVDVERARRTICASRGAPLTDDEWSTYLVGATPRELCES